MVFNGFLPVTSTGPYGTPPPATLYTVGYLGFGNLQPRFKREGWCVHRRHNRSAGTISVAAFQLSTRVCCTPRFSGPGPWLILYRWCASSCLRGGPKTSTYAFADQVLF